MKRILIYMGLAMAMMISCSKDPDDPLAPGPSSGSPVHFDPQLVPYPLLSEYNFFAGDMAGLSPVEGVLPYDVITPLFSDHAKKARFIWMPAGAKAEYIADDKPLDFDDGTVLIKNFYFEGVGLDDQRRIIETRLLFKRNGAWEFANYIWNSEHTDAVLDLQGSNTLVELTMPDGDQLSIDYRIPSYGECLTCHKEDLQPFPIGPKPQNLNMPFNYGNGTMGQLQKWAQVGYLQEDLPANIGRIAKWDDVNEPLQDRVRAYLDMNCAHCHSEDRYCSYRPLRFAWQETTDPANLGICIEPEEMLVPTLSHIVASGNIDRSMLYYRINSTEVNERMPLLGRSVVHEEALQLIEEWILSLDPPCN